MGVAARRTLWLGTRMNIRFHELHLTVNPRFTLHNIYFSAHPGCVIGGGLAGLATCFEETVRCNWTGWTGFFNNYGCVPLCNSQNSGTSGTFSGNKG